MKLHDILSLMDQLEIPYQMGACHEMEIHTFCPLNQLQEHAITWIKKYENFDRSEVNRYEQLLLFASADYYNPHAKNTIFIENLKSNFFLLLKAMFKDLNPEVKPANIEKTSTVLSTGIGKDVYIGHNCFIDTDVKIGNHVTIMHNVVIQGNVEIGDYSFIESGAMIGVSGFGLASDKENNPFVVPHFGRVIIGEYVRICAGTCVCRGCLSDTIIDDYTKIDNLCHIAHNVRVGKRVAITANCEISGSAVIQDDTWLGPGTTVLNGITVGKQVFSGIATNIIRDVEDDALIYGNPGKAKQKKGE